MKLKTNGPLLTRENLMEIERVLNALGSASLEIRNGDLAVSARQVYTKDNASTSIDISPLLGASSSITTLPYSATLDIDFAEMDGGTYYMHLTGAITLTMSNFASGRRVTLLFTADASRAITEPAGLNPCIISTTSGSLEHGNTASTTRNIRLDYLCAGDSIGTVFTGPIH